MTSTTKPTLAARLFVTPFLLLLGLGGGAMLNIAIHGIGEARESGSWPTVAGKIVTSEMVVDASRTGNRDKTSDWKAFTAKIEYEFVVNGAKQRGSRVAAVQDMNANREHVLKVLNKYPVDRAVKVSYKPDDPSVCVLEPGSWGGTVVFFAMGSVFTLLSLGLLILLWKPRSAASSVGTRPSERKTKIWASALLLVFIGIGCVPLTWAVQAIREASASESWPTVPGKITKSRVSVTTTENRERNQRRTSHSYSAEIEYEFEVEGSTYHGSRIAVVSDQLGDEGFAEEICEKYPLNKTVTVSYKPGAPSECLLEPGHWGGVGFQLAFAGVFILLPLLILKAFWLPKANVDEYGQSKEQRQRFGFLFSERILEWEPGHLIHTHHDRAGFLKVLISAVIGGLVFGVIITMFPGVGLLCFKEYLPRTIAQHGFQFVGYFYAVVSCVSAIGIGIWALFDGRVRDSLIDWTRGTFRNQVGWSIHEFPLDEISGLTFRLPSPKPVAKGANASMEQTKKFSAKVFVNVAGRKFLLLKTEFVRSVRSSIRQRLFPEIQQLAERLNVPLQEDISPP